MKTNVEFPRRYVAADADFGVWETAERYYRELVDRPINSIEELERWLLDAGELEGCFDEEDTKRYVAMTCQTDDAEREQSYLDFTENVKPKRKPWSQNLRERFVALADQFELPPERYEVMERSARAAIEIYRDENIPLQTEEDRRKQQHQKTMGAMTCTYDGREQTLQQMARYYEEPDRRVREEAWRLVAERVNQDEASLDEQYDKLVALRHKIAQNAGCRDYREYTFKAYERFDYTPQDCLAFHDAIERVVVPAVQQLHAERMRSLGIDTLRPWDLNVDPDNRPPLRPFETDDQLAGGCSRVFHKVHDDLGAVFDGLRERGLLDLGSRKGKAPGGYQATYAERRLPFIFMNAVGTEGDVRTLLHEGGHAFHLWACRDEPLYRYRDYPTEFAEVASMGMECLSVPHLDTFYGDETPRARRRFFEQIVKFFPWMARVDAFQHYVYTHVDHDPQRRKDEWWALTQRFAPLPDWTGLEAYGRSGWHLQLHIFQYPFYYVEYGIAQLGALQVWMNSRRDYARAVEQYRRGLALGGSRPLPALFEAAGLRFDFTEATLRPLIDAVMEEIGRS